MNANLASLIPWIPALGAALCGVLVALPSLKKLAGPICFASIFIPFLITCGLYSGVQEALKDGSGIYVHAFNWLSIEGVLQANFSYFLDGLTMVMLFVVTGIGSLIAWYAMGYMAHDDGYARFFAAVCLFIFAMTNLVMADNLILLFLGWEGVGLCSYLLIGHYFKFPVAVAAAKKAFIVNRVGDLGFALGIFMVYQTFGSVQYEVIFAQVSDMLSHSAFEPTTAMKWIPFLLMIGAFGKSAQGPLLVWLPDAMAGPTPVSALVHAATMVTAGVFMIARLTPLFLEQMSPYAMDTVAIVGAATCIFAATIGLCSNDLKGVFAYSTVSQLGYMFLGVAVLSVGGVFHLATHAFFKALLFLTAGSVMHALAGTLDIRTMSGLRKKMPVTCWLMFFGCLALAGFPFTSGFYSKDKILGDAMTLGLGHNGHGGEKLYLVLAIVGIVTAGLTAFYTFRLWFRVFMGPEKYAMGDHGHTPDNDLERAMIAVAKEEAEHTGHHAHEPHEMSWSMNAPLVILAIGSIAFGWWALSGDKPWIKDQLYHSTHFAMVDHHDAHHEYHHWYEDPHKLTEAISAAVALTGIGLAALFHWWRRDLVAKVTRPFAPVVTVLANKYYVDEIYDALIRRPLRGFGHFLYVFDDLVVMGLVQLFGWLPRLGGRGLQPMQSGRLQGYGLGMVGGLGLIALIILYNVTWN